MLVVLHPTYTLRLEIKDRMQQSSQQQGFINVSGAAPPVFKPHKFWDHLSGKSGCDEVLAAVKKALVDAGIEAEVFLERFEHKS